MLGVRKHNLAKAAWLRHAGLLAFLRAKVAGT